MRAVFGLLGLLIVLAIVGSLAKRQLQAVQVPLVPGGGASAAALGGTPAEASRQLQRKVADDVNKALQQGAARNDSAGQ